MVFGRNTSKRMYQSSLLKKRKISLRALKDYLSVQTLFSHSEIILTEPVRLESVTLLNLVVQPVMMK
jgi:hypothetical protein